MAKATILIIEDDPDIRELLAFSLAKEGWTIVMAADGEEGLAALPTANPDCVVLDIMLPGIDGLEVLRTLKSDPARKRLPVIMTTAKGEESDVVTGLELGAEDYVVKPYSPKVLVARIRAALRRSVDLPRQSLRAETVLSRGAITLDPARHEVRVDERKVDLSATEFAILEFLLRNPGWVFSRSQIIDAVKGRDYPVTDRAVDVQILSLAAQARRRRRRDRDGAGRRLPHQGLTALASSLFKRSLALLTAAVLVAAFVFAALGMSVMGRAYAELNSSALLRAAEAPLAATLPGRRSVRPGRSRRHLRGGRRLERLSRHADPARRQVLADSEAVALDDGESLREARGRRGPGGRRGRLATELRPRWATIFSTRPLLYCNPRTAPSAKDA